MRNLFLNARIRVQAYRQAEQGQTIVEYGLVVGLISVVVIAALFTAVDGGVGVIAGKITTAMM